MAALRASPLVFAPSSVAMKSKRLGHDRVHDDQRVGDRLAGADRAELELVAGEGKRAGPVAVARVLRERGQRVHADGEEAGLLRVPGAALGDLLEDVGELVAEEHGDDGRGRFVGAEAVVVAGGGRRAAQRGRRAWTARMTAAQNTAARCCGALIAGREQVGTTGAGDQFRCLPEPLMRRTASRAEAGHAVLLGGAAASPWSGTGGRSRGLRSRRPARFHGPGPLRCGDVLTGTPSLQEFALGFGHAGGTRSGCAEILVFQLLALGKQRRSVRRRCEVGAREEKLRSIRKYSCSQPQWPTRPGFLLPNGEHARLHIQRLHRAEQRGLRPAPRRSTNRTPWGCTAWCRSGFRMYAGLVTSTR